MFFVSKQVFDNIWCKATSPCIFSFPRLLMQSLKKFDIFLRESEIFSIIKIIVEFYQQIFLSEEFYLAPVSISWSLSLSLSRFLQFFLSPDLMMGSLDLDQLPGLRTAKYNLHFVQIIPSHSTALSVAKEPIYEIPHSANLQRLFFKVNLPLTYQCSKWNDV